MAESGAYEYGRSHERLADELYTLSLSDDLTRKESSEKAARLLSSQKNPGTSARALDLLRVASLSDDPIEVRNPSYMTCYTYSSKEDAFWKLVWNMTKKDVSFDNLTDNTEYSALKSMPCRYVSFLMYFYSEMHNITKYAQSRNINNLEEAGRKYKKIILDALGEDRKGSRFTCSVATKEVTNNTESKLHWMLFRGIKAKGMQMFMPYQYLIEPWTQVNLDGTSKKKKKGDSGKVGFFWMPKVYSELYWNTQIKPVKPIKVSRLLLRNLTGLRFVCNGNIGLHWFTNDLSVRTCNAGMNFKGLSALALDGMPLECIVWQDVPKKSLTSVSIIDTSNRNLECEGQFVDGKWMPLSCGPEFEKLGVIKMYNNNFGLERADCPKLRELHFGGHPLTYDPGEEDRFYTSTRCPALSPIAPLKKLIFRSDSDMRFESSFPVLHREGGDKKLPLYRSLEMIKFMNVGIPHVDFLKTLRYITDGNVGPKVIEIDNLFTHEARPALGMVFDGPPIIDGFLGQEGFDYLFSPHINCTTLTVVNMFSIENIKTVTRNMRQLASLEIRNLAANEGFSLADSPIKSLAKVKHVGIKWDSPTRVALAAKSPSKSKKGRGIVQENVSLSPQRAPAPLVANVQYDAFLDQEEEEDQGPDAETLRQDYLDAINDDYSKCFGSPWTNFEGQTRILQWPPWYQDIDPRGERSLEYLESFLKWEEEAMRWIVGEDWEMIHVESTPEGEVEVADIKDPEEGFEFEIVSFEDLRSRNPRSIFLETGVGLNASESGLFYENHVFTFEASFLSRDEVLAVEESKYAAEGSVDARTARVMADRASLLDSLRNGTCSFLFPLTRGARHLGFLQAADLGVENADFQEGMNVESVTDKLVSNLSVQSFKLSGQKSEPGMASGISHLPTEDLNVFQIEYVDETLRPDIGSPVSRQNPAFVMPLGTLEFGEDGSFKFTFSCSVPVKLLGLQCFKALGFYSQSAWEARVGQQSSTKGKGEEEEETEGDGDPLPKLFRTLDRNGGFSESADTTPFRLVPEAPFLSTRTALDTALRSAQQINALPLPQMTEEEWARTQNSIGRFSLQAALLFMYTMGRGMQSVLSMPYFQMPNPVSTQFSRIFQFYISPIMRWCCQDYPRDMAPSMDLISYRFDDIMGLLASANHSWSTKDKPGEDGANKKFAMNLYSRIITASRQLIDGIQEFVDHRSWLAMDEAINKALSAFKQMESIIFGGEQGDDSKLKSTLSRQLFKALGSSSGRAKGAFPSKKKMTKGVGKVIDEYYGNQEQIEQLIVEQATAPQDLTAGLLISADLGDDEDEDDDFVALDEEEWSSEPATPSSAERNGGSPTLMEISSESPLGGTREVLNQFYQFFGRRKEERSPDSPSTLQTTNEFIKRIERDDPIIIIPSYEGEEPEPRSLPPTTPIFKPRQQAPPPQSPVVRKKKRVRKQSSPKRKPLPSLEQVEKDLSTKRRAQVSPDVSPIHATLKKRVKAKESSPQRPGVPPPSTVIVIEDDEDEEAQLERTSLDLARQLKERAARLKTAEALQAMTPTRSPQMSFGRSVSGISEFTSPVSRPPPASPIATLEGSTVQGFGAPQATTPLLQQRTTESEADRLARENAELKRQLEEAQMREIAMLRDNLQREIARRAELERRLAMREQGQTAPATSPRTPSTTRKKKDFTNTFIISKVCAICKNNEIKGQCPRCKSVFYCGKSHYKEHYAEHKKTCQGMAQ